MAQPTTLIATPDPDDRRMPPCPDFCDGTCAAWPEEEGDAHHTSGFTTLTVPGDRRGTTTDLDMSVSRTDDDFRAGTPEVNLLGFDHGGVTLPAFQARQLAALLLDAADLADPLPVGVMVTTADKVRLGDEILTEAGWRTVVGQMAFAESEDSCAQVNVWTDDCDHDPETQGWEFVPDHAVQVRRPVHGSCAIQFVEPIA